jgi:hypothetical protein
VPDIPGKDLFPFDDVLGSKFPPFSRLSAFPSANARLFFSQIRLPVTTSLFSFRIENQ